MRDENTLDPGHHADSGDDAGPDGELGVPARQWREFEERRVRVDQEFDSLPGEQATAVVVAGYVLRATALTRRLQELLELGQTSEHCCMVRLKGRRPDVKMR